MDHTFVTEESYLRMLKFFFWPKVVREDHTLYYFQQDGTSPQKGPKVPQKQIWRQIQ
jgi:hypothetical protein